MLAHKLDRADLARMAEEKDWWMSEKYDGVRAIWNGKQLLSRSGKRFHAPAWFTDKLPKQVGLDGELWAGPGQFQQTVSIVRRKRPPLEGWDRVKFMVFDILHPSCVDLPFAVRYKWYTKFVAKARGRGVRFIQAVKQTRLTSERQAVRLYRRILAAGGEGMVVRSGRSTYEAGKRSRTLLKWKPIPDMEAKVVGFVEGKGKHEGRLGAFKVELLTGERLTFNLAGQLDDALRSAYKFTVDQPLPVISRRDANGRAVPRMHSLVKLQYMSLTDRGLPRQPVYVGLRDKRDR